MTDEGNAARLNYQPLPNEQDVRIKDDLINPTKRQNSKYFLELTKDNRLSNINSADQEYWMEKTRLTKELVNLYHFMALDEIAEMVWSEYATELNTNVSIDGFQIKHLGSTTGTQRTEVYSNQSPGGKQ